MSLTDVVQAQEYQRKNESAQRLQEQWPMILAQLKNKSPEEAFSLLAPIVGTNDAIKYMEQLRIGQNQQYMQNLLGDISPEMGGGMPQEGMAGEILPPEGAGMPQQGGGAFSRTSDDKLQIIAGMNHPLAESAKLELQRRMQEKQFGFEQQKYEEGRQRETENDYFNRVDTLGKQYVKDAEPYLSKLETYQNALDLNKQAETNDNGQADYQLMKLAVQINDRKASAVTDGEADQVINSGGLADRFGKAFDGYVYGAKFTPEARQKLMNVIKSSALQSEKRLGQLNKGYGNRASKARVELDDVLAPYAIPPVAEIEASLNAPEAPNTFTVQGQTVTMQEIEETAKNRGLTVEQVKQHLGIK